MISSQGQSSANQANVALAQQEMNWETQMSNTAMQRRVADLKDAGLNPMLAVGQGGASVPSPVMPTVQNPSAGLGSGVASAGQIAANTPQAMVNQQVGQAQVSNLNSQSATNAAQANKMRVEADKLAGVDTDQSRQNISESQSRQALMDLQGKSQVAEAALSTQQVENARAALPEIQARIDQLGSAANLNEFQAKLSAVQARVASLNAMQIQWLMPSIAQSAEAAAKKSTLELPEAESKAGFWSSAMGKISPYMTEVGNYLKTINPIVGMFVK